MKKSILFALLALAAWQATAQRKFRAHPENDPGQPRNKGKVTLLHIAYGIQNPGGDLAARFGWNTTIGGGVDFMTAKNLILGVDFAYLYGQKVKEDPLTPIRTDSGYVIGNERSIADVNLRERGFYVGGQVGKLFTFGKSRSGLRVVLGAGFLRHKIRVQDDSRSVTQLTGDYRKGYDRLTGGPALNQFIGYQLLGKTRSINYFIGIELNEGFTRSLRAYDFAERKKLEGGRFDFRYGLRAGWALPFYVAKAATIYY